MECIAAIRRCWPRQHGRSLGSRTRRWSTVAATFDPHPIELLRPDAVPPRLTTIAHRAELLQQYGVDCVIVFPTTPRFLTMTAEDFFQTIVRTELQARGLVEGPNFFFGRNRAGSITMLRGHLIPLII